jgi:uncharacterized protein YecE (DUF72 family)
MGHGRCAARTPGGGGPLAPREVAVGCSGFPEAQARYFREFRAVEVQQTFYDPPRPETAARWRAAAGPDFHFTIKAWQAITHEASSPTYRRLRQPIPPAERSRYGAFRPTAEVGAAWERTRQVARALGADAVLFQCPASFGPTDENVGRMRTFFRRADRDGLAFAWEPRGGWPATLVARLCGELELVHAVDPFAARPLAGSFRYFRLHGIGGVRHRFTDEELRRLAGWVVPGPAFVFFNNMYMLPDARRFRALLAPPPPVRGGQPARRHAVGGTLR